MASPVRRCTARVVVVSIVAALGGFPSAVQATDEQGASSGAVPTSAPTSALLRCPLWRPLARLLRRLARLPHRRSSPNSTN